MQVRCIEVEDTIVMKTFFLCLSFQSPFPNKSCTKFLMSQGTLIKAPEVATRKPLLQNFLQNFFAHGLTCWSYRSNFTLWWTTVDASFELCLQPKKFPPIIWICSLFYSLFNRWILHRLCFREMIF